MDRWKSLKNDIGVAEKHVIALAQYTKNSLKKKFFIISHQLHQVLKCTS